MSQMLSLTGIQKFNWFILWFVLRGALSIGLFDLAEIKVFHNTNGYILKEFQLWAIPFNLIGDLILEVAIVLIGIVPTLFVLSILSFLGLRRIFEKLFGPIFKKRNSNSR